MKTLLVALIALASTAFADQITYDTNPSTLICGIAFNCVQDTPTEITLGGSLNLSYFAGSGSNVTTPSEINFGYIQTTGASSGVNVAGLILNLDIDSTPPGANGHILGGIVGGISTNQSIMVLTFPVDYKVTIGAETYAVTQRTLGIIPTADGNPAGQTTIQAYVTSSDAPEPAVWISVLVGLLLIRAISYRKIHC